MDRFLALSCFINFPYKIITSIVLFRLTTRPPRSKTKLHPVEDNVNLSLAEKRYERVRRWTKKVNIFEKDFVIVPINEHSHWFVAVICYPGLVGKRRMDNNEVIPVCTYNIFFLLFLKLKHKEIGIPDKNSIHNS